MVVPSFLARVCLAAVLPRGAKPGSAQAPEQRGAPMAPGPLMMSPASPATGKPPGDAGSAQGAHVLQSLPGACLPAALLLVGSCCPTCGTGVAFRRRARVAPGSTPGRSSLGFSPLLSAEADGFGAGEHPFFWHRLVVKFLQVSEMHGPASTAAIAALFQGKKKRKKRKKSNLTFLCCFFFKSLWREMLSPWVCITPWPLRPGGPQPCWVDDGNAGGSGRGTSL